jgi:bidirectional [NiFe] hydrogenase diaphorase subunit
MTKHQRRPDALIEILHKVQDAFGYVPAEAMQFIAREMRIPPTRICGIVTFCQFFSLRPKGRHNSVK